MTASPSLATARIEQVGTPKEVYERPATRLAASFIGETNFFSGHATGQETGRTRITAEGGSLGCREHAPMPTGTPVAVAVRPERVTISPAGFGPPGLHGTLTEFIYFGSTRKAVVRLGDGQDGMSPMAADAIETRGLSVGQAVTLAWDGTQGTAFGSTEAADQVLWSRRAWRTRTGTVVRSWAILWNYRGSTNVVGLVWHKYVSVDPGHAWFRTWLAPLAVTPWGVSIITLQASCPDNPAVSARRIVRKSPSMVSRSASSTWAPMFNAATTRPSNLQTGTATERKPCSAS